MRPLPALNVSHHRAGDDDSPLETGPAAGSGACFSSAHNIRAHVVLKVFSLRSKSIRVDQHPLMPMLFQPPVGKMLGKPTCRSLRRKIPHRESIHNGNAKLRDDSVRAAPGGIRMDSRRDIERLEAPLDVLQGRLD